MNASFSRSAVALLVALALLVLALSALLPSCDTSPTSSGRKVDPGSHSVSAIGHAGFYDVLRRMGRPVGRSTGGALDQVGPHGLLILAEPQIDNLDSLEDQELLTAPRLLLVLPKWRGTPDDYRPSWAADLNLYPEDLVGDILAQVDETGEVLRRNWPRQWPTNEIGPVPSGPLADMGGPPSDLRRVVKLNQIQLMRSAAMRPVVALGEELLVGELEIEDQIIWVLSDPDLMSNQGLVRGDNALFMVALVDRLRNWDNDDERAPIIFEESIHGFFSRDHSPTSLIFRFPFVVVTALICLAALLAVLAGVGRFGAPLKPRPSLDFGKAGLIANGARLLDFAGHQAIMLRRYCWMTAVTVARSLHAPSGLNDRALTEWLDQVGRARGVKRSCSEILSQVPGPFEAGGDANLTRLFQSARDIYHWRLEMEGRTGASGKAGRPALP